MHLLWKSSLSGSLLIVSNYLYKRYGLIKRSLDLVITEVSLATMHLADCVHTLLCCRSRGLQLQRLSQADPLVTSTQHAAHLPTSQAIVWEPGEYKHSTISLDLLYTLHEPSPCCLTIIADIQASVWHKMVCYVLCLPKTTVYSFTTWPHCHWKIL